MSAQEHQDADIALALLAEMKRPDTFQLLVDRLPPSPERVGLRLWGALYGVYTVTDELSRQMRQETQEYMAAQDGSKAMDSRQPPELNPQPSRGAPSPRRGPIGRAIAACAATTGLQRGAQPHNRRAQTAAAHALVDGVAALARLHTDYQRASIPPPSRDQPFPPREEMERARQIKALRERLEGLDGWVRGVPVPTADKTWARFRQELSLLTQLLDVDCRLIEACEALRTQASACTPLSWRNGDDAVLLTAALDRIEGVVRNHARLLSAPF